MAEMQEFSPGGSSKISHTQRKHLALGGLVAVALFASFWGGVQFQKTRTASNGPSVNTASQHGYYYGGSNSYQAPNNSSLDVQSN
ncbi:MAG TPA: hypothetical protein VJ843_01440 [Candidatus Saccharimonadales bacterium]|nr:hypothetical protein [Candidatus Saccharimonadales bacterium]